MINYQTLAHFKPDVITAESCPICLEDFLKSEEAVSHLSGGVKHGFHKKCFSEVIKTAQYAKSLSCPLCKKLISQKSFLTTFNHIELSSEKMRTDSWLSNFYDLIRRFSEETVDYRSWRNDAEVVFEELKALLDNYHLLRIQHLENTEEFSNCLVLLTWLNGYFLFVRSLAEKTGSVILIEDNRPIRIVLDQVQTKHVIVLMDNLLKILELKKADIKEDFSKVFCFRLICSNVKSLFSIGSFIMSFSLARATQILANKNFTESEQDLIAAFSSSVVSVMTYLSVDKIAKSYFKGILLSSFKPLSNVQISFL